MSDAKQAEIRIVIAQRGWVFIGRVSREEHEIVLRDAKGIRRWGTTKGLGELWSGPKANTVLDDAGTVRLHPLQCIAQIDVDQAKWDEVLSASAR
jgi:hypothetical protein